LKYWELELFRGTDLDARSLKGLHEHESVQKLITTRIPGGALADLELLGNVYSEGDRLAIQWNIRDVTERRRIDETTRRPYERPQASHQFEAIGKLAGSVAEDFGNLLGAVGGYTEMLKQRFGEDDPASANVTEIRHALERAGLLARQLMVLSGRRPPRAEIVTLTDLVSDMESIIRIALPQNINLQIEHGAELKPVKADRGQLEQVILNLALNAQESMPAGGTLSLRTYNMNVGEDYSREHPAVLRGEYTVLEISDTGHGLSYEPQGDVAEPVVTAAGRTSRLSELSSISSLIRQFGGCVWAASEFGRGTTFRIFLAHVTD
jgi:two-component system cell cycle sensor histidine kinase/response regulator CckA